MSSSNERNKFFWKRHGAKAIRAEVPCLVNRQNKRGSTELLDFMRNDQDTNFNVTDRRASMRGRPTFLTNGGSMYRYLTALFMLVALGLFADQVQAQNIVHVSGYLSGTRELHPRVPSNSALDTIYYIEGNYSIGSGAKLLVDEGAELWFQPNSRIIDSAGGKLIANGFAGHGPLNEKNIITFRGSKINAYSVEWGHIIVLPGSDSAYFANVRFTNFVKRNTVDVTELYSVSGDPVDAAYDAAFDNVINGVGACIATFSHKTYLYDVLVDSCQASFAGGAFAFLQSPAGFPLQDDGRLALKNRQVALLTIRDTRVYNKETTAPTSVTALGGAIYMASNSATYNPADSLVGYLGENAFVTGTPSDPTTFTAAQDVELFERCTANNTFTTSADFAEGGAIYIGSNTGLILSQATFNSDSAIATVNGVGTPDENALGGAIAVSPFSGNPNQTNTGANTDKAPGLAIFKSATFRGDVAGKGGAIWVGMPPINSGDPAPRLIVNSEHIVPPTVGGSSIPWRDSGKIWFDKNIAFMEGGAIYSPNKVYVTGYLAPQDFPWPGGSAQVELRVEFSNNEAGIGGGSIFLDAFSGGTPDLIERRAWHINNSVNPYDINVNRGSLYGAMVIGGGAEFVGLRDSTFATEFNGNLVVGGSGGGVYIEDGVASGNQVPINRFFAENEYNAQNPRIPRDTFSSASIFPFDQRELTRFIGNRAALGPDSAALYSYNPAASGGPATAHGRGGGLFVAITSQSTEITPLDSTFLSRVRFEEDTAYSGSAIWCDKYDFKFMSNQTLIANNVATSPSSATVDLDSTGISNPSDPNAGATIWADFEGPLPSYESNSRGDAIYDNQARYILRLPVSLLTGVSGADTLRGNFWGETGPDVITEINPPTGPQQQTFFIDYYKGCFTNIFEPNSNPSGTYFPVQIGTIPDTLLMEGRIYDLYDHGTDMKVADYENRRLAIAEAFSLGLPDTIQAMHRYTRNIFDQNAVYVNKIDQYQTDFQGPQPLGYPLFLQADVPLNDTNYDPYARNYTVFMVFNTTTNEFVRVNLKETKVAEGTGDSKQIYQGRLDFVPDSSVAERHPTLREQTLYTLSLLRPNIMTFDEVQRASMLEDSAALKGREYMLSPSDLMAAGDSVFGNCESGGFQGATKWYAGERYHTLPVRPGDNILVISRTMLWKYGPAYAIANGIKFTIGNVQAPGFVADVPALQSDPYNPNVKFVHEDVSYDGSTPALTLFRVAGYDANAFYDPRYLFNPQNYTQLAISVTPDLFKGDVIPTVGSPVPGQPGNFYSAAAVDSVRNHVRLNYWLKARTVFNQNITGSNGYVELYGQPHNPDVVPGGEWLTATLTNYPPNFASESGLLDSISASQLGNDSLALSMWAFPPSMNCERIPDTSIANPDSLCVAASAATYHFRIIVMDSLPLFLPSTNPCGAVLTDSLRYTLDLQTDDEMEDDSAAAQLEAPATTRDASQHPAWDFRYGRTAYNFATEPSWMVHPSGGQYVKIDSTDPNFRLHGIINVRLDSVTAVAGGQFGGPYLLPVPQVNGELNLDTIAAVEANDGHAGKSLQRWAVPILFVPTILNDSLPAAMEGTDYSQNFQDPTQINRILIQNLNPAQSFTYKLIYKGQTEYLYRDIQNKIPAADSAVGSGSSSTLVVRSSHIGTPDTVVGHTPTWLSIDPYSGVLTGVPGDTDAPRTATSPCGQDTVTVVVTDGTCVATWAQFPLNVDSVNHPPHFIAGPHELCVTNGTPFCDSVLAYDVDLLRSPCAAERLTFTSLDPRVTVTVAGTTGDTVSGQALSDTVKLNVCGTYTEPQQYFQSGTVVPELIRLQVVDASGDIDTLTYPVHLGLAPAFECAIYVSNPVTTLHPLKDIQKLCFGAGQFGTDSLDLVYCEFEDAPAPPTSAFDARWVLPIAGQFRRLHDRCTQQWKSERGTYLAGAIPAR